MTLTHDRRAELLGGCPLFQGIDAAGLPKLAAPPPPASGAGAERPDVTKPGPAAAVPPSSAGTRTFLFSDIEGSTRLLDELGSETYTTVLERQAALLRAAFLAHGGKEEGTEG